MVRKITVLRSLYLTYSNLMIHCLGTPDIQEVCQPLRKTEMTEETLSYSVKDKVCSLCSLQ